MVTALIDGLRENACVVHDAAPGTAVGLVVARAVARAAGGVIAVAAGDAVVDALGLVPALRASGAALLAPDDAAWTEQVADAAVGVTGALFAVAHPPAVAVACGPGAPRATSLLPPVHVCVVRESDVLAGLAEGIARLAAAPLPSAVSWIGGPSRTGDLEMVQTLGVHGPVAVEVVVARGE
jgi:L-lactate dehydrogenase complex protein LldG